MRNEKKYIIGDTFFISGPIILQIVLKPPPWPTESKSVLRFEIA